ncbi:hypothetical protein F506_00675 [Herbaspirillum hiltneri N3]|uniref:CNP1-like uncharacterized domain-containing protein n=1 Tax=Herbaspirillum hiltneri N3 TaxID=1262470 RepID=A0ABM5UVW3_9BURK|nr:CNP1-like family protein [Herbaspirillum hiltneri]AKZ61373.1 hypothetical protein F506_00675 [Herbaspirillum hiltneri N3]
MPQRFWNTFASPRLVRRLAAGVLLCSATLGFAQQMGNFDEEFDDEEKPWQEIAVQLPPAPLPENLAEFYVGPTTTSKSYVDLKSLSIGSDNVVRYIMVTKSSGGATNVIYSGIRCETYEIKQYAFGRSDGSWSRSRHDKWIRIKDAGANRQDAALYKSYFCQIGMLAGDLRKISNRLRENRPIDPAKE